MRYRNPRILLVAVLLAPVAYAPRDSVAAADTAATTGWVEEVIVVGARDRRPIEDVVGVVNVIRREALLDQMAVGLADAVRYVPGVSVATADNRFGDTELTVRGLSGNRVVSLVDGIPAADQFDIGAFSNSGQDWLVVDSISRIEILRGPASTLFGSDALAGVVATVTRSPEEILRGEDLGSEGTVLYSGSDHSVVVSGSLAGRAGPGTGALMLSRQEGKERESAARSPEDELDRRRDGAMAKFELDLPRDQILRLQGNYFHEQVDSQLASILGYGRRYRSTTSLAGDDRRRRYSVALGYDVQSDLPWLESATVNLYRQHTEVDQRTAESRDLAQPAVDLWRAFKLTASAAGATVDLRSHWDGPLAEHRLGWGLQYQNTRFEEQRNGFVTTQSSGETSNVLLGEVMPVRDFPNTDVAKMAVYLHDEISLGRWTVIPGLRYEHHRLSASSDPIFAGDNVSVPVADASESQWVPKLGVTWQPTERLTWYAQYARGFRAPSFEDVNVGLDIPLFNYRGLPNPELEAETSDGMDIGVRVAADHWRLDAAGFYARYDDFILSRVYVGDDPISGARLFQSINVGEARIYGVELSVQADLQATFAVPLELGLSASLSRGEDKVSGEPLQTVDPYEFIVSANWRPRSDLQLALHGSFAAAPRHDDGADLFHPSGYGVWDLIARYQPTPSVQLRAGIFNLTDKTYWRWASIRGRAQDDPLNDVLAQPGRHLSVGIHVNLGGML